MTEQPSERNMGDAMQEYLDIFITEPQSSEETQTRLQKWYEDPVSQQLIEEISKGPRLPWRPDYLSTNRRKGLSKGEEISLHLAHGYLVTAMSEYQSNHPEDRDTHSLLMADFLIEESYIRALYGAGPVYKKWRKDRQRYMGELEQMYIQKPEVTGETKNE